MSWLPQHQLKCTSAARAVELVRSHDRVWIQPGCATPEVLIEALTKRAFQLQDVELCHMMTLGNASYTCSEYEGHFRHNGLFLGSNVRAAAAAGRADYTPLFLSEIEQLFTSGELKIDVAFIQTSPPDEHGFFSLGASIDCTLAAARSARYVIAEVNDRMPRTLGDTFLHINEITAIVESSRPLFKFPPEPAPQLQQRITVHVASLIPGGATLQLGIGGIPDAVLQSLDGKRDLGIHAEMCSDSVIPLIENGTINCSRKSIHRGKIVARILRIAVPHTAQEL